MKRGFVVHLRFFPFGGAELYCARVIEILQRRFDAVTIYHIGPAPTFEEFQAWCGVTLDPGRVNFVQIALPRLLRLLTRNAAGTGWTLILQAFMARVARRAASRFDLTISTFAETPMPGVRIIQSIHIPMFTTDPQILFYCGMPAENGLKRFLRRLYQQAMLIAMGGGGRKQIARQLSVTNSHWTKDQFMRVYPGANARALHFGIRVSLTPTSSEWVDFNARENNLVILGRITESKRIETAIKITEGLRKIGHDVGLIIVGGGSGPYLEQLERYAASFPFVQFRKNLDRATLERLIAKQKWGIHCYHFEHYGFAPAELQALGCITFVHDSGGQREIIADARQRYLDSPDAVQKIDLVMRSPDLQAQLLAAAKTSVAEHTVEKFCADFDALLD